MTDQHGEAGAGLAAGRSVPFESAGSAHADA
ncbi:MAG: hypothetical protein QOK11_3288, partial [Pseudonocardiales bacterium]|nr:hypothetical protein [Pseudonocardiales bacterium]